MARNESYDSPDETPNTQRFNRGKSGTHPLDKSFQPRPEGVVEELGGDELQTLGVTWSDEFSFFRDNSFWEELETILANCDEIMLQLGWDRKAGNGRNFPNNRTSEPFSRLWYAGKIGFECWNLLTWHRGHGPNEITLAQTLYLGRLLTEAEWRDAFKPSILTGKKQRKALSELRDVQNRTAVESVSRRRELIVDLVKETRLSGGALDKWIVAQFAERHSIHVGERTVRGDRAAIRT